eukprot:CAMPEP_0201540134 /NCGR_PEP_ID=MMETSP0161_2-20130828/70776_1 /ASSEMBLY_ACC=CAM_ASM_000251 /TAXON_ID=180227 /ORGANISM="Neoparamoeba aestuarina, Strain SoJaBio B1-5/56/2" /LENGTH=536 /DNA_ID=CAMNT_0047947583 /DNA_START=2362 /DNA_END=3973 /DNA_ORIENTATION=-
MSRIDRGPTSPLPPPLNTPLPPSLNLTPPSSPLPSPHSHSSNPSPNPSPTPSPNPSPRPPQPSPHPPPLSSPTGPPGTSQQESERLKAKEEKMEKALLAWGGTETKEEREKREKMEEALAAWGGDDGGGGGSGKQKRHRDSVNMKFLNKGFPIAASSDPMNAKQGGKKRRSRDLDDVDKLSGSGGSKIKEKKDKAATLSRNSSRTTSKGGRRRSSITMFVEQASTSTPPTTSSHNNNPAPGPPASQTFTGSLGPGSGGGGSSNSLAPVPFATSPRSISSGSSKKKRRGSLFADPLPVPGIGGGKGGDAGGDHGSILQNFRSVSPNPTASFSFSPSPRLFGGDDSSHSTGSGTNRERSGSRSKRDTKHQILKTKNFRTLTHIQIIELMEDVLENPNVDGAAMLGLVRQMTSLFAVCACSLRRLVCEVFTQIEPFHKAFQTLLVFSVNTADQQLRRQSANFLTSVLTSLSSSLPFSSSYSLSYAYFEELFKGCEFFFFCGRKESGGGRAGAMFVSDCMESIMGRIDEYTPPSVQQKKF